MPRTHRISKPPARSAEDLAYINAWFDMVTAWQGGNPNAWDEAFRSVPAPAPQESKS
jgi:hypothetical protein